MSACVVRCPHCGKSGIPCSVTNGSTHCPTCGKRIDVKNGKVTK